MTLGSDKLTLNQMIDRITKNGTELPWNVDVERGKASSETIDVTFYKSVNGGFSVASYRRKDHCEADLIRNEPCIHEALACIHLE